MKNTFTPYTIAKGMKANRWCDSFLLTNISEIKTALKFDNSEISDIEAVKFIKFIFEANIKANRARKYYNNCRDFDLDRYKIYVDTCKGGDNNSDHYLYLLCGKYAQEEREKRRASRPVRWDPVSYASRHGITLEEAEIKIATILKNKCTSLEGFINRHGEEKGTAMFEEWAQKCRQSEENFLKRYGPEKGKIEWEKHVERKRAANPRCREYWIKRGITEEEEIQKSITEFQLNNAGVNLECLTRKYGAEVALQKHADINSRKDASSLSYFLDKYGDTPEAYLRYNQSCESKDSVSVKSFLARGHTHEEALELNKQAVQKRRSGSSSKESNNFFEEIIQTLNLQEEKIHTNNNEWFLYDERLRKFYLYDFTIFANDAKCIIEYHGVAFHPSCNLTEQRFSEWRSPYSKQTADEVRAHDNRKKELAAENGFAFLEVWSDDANNKVKVTDFLKTQLKL